MKPRWFVPVGVSLLLSGACVVGAAEVFLKESSEPITGEVAGIGDGEFIIQLEDGELRRIKESDLVQIVFDPSAVTQQLGSAKADLRFHGSRTVGERLVPGLVEAFVEDRGGRGFQWVQIESEVEQRLIVKQGGNFEGIPREVDVYSHGSPTAFNALQAEEADIGMSSRPIKQGEWLDLAAWGDFQSAESQHVIALDGLAVLVHPSSPITTLSLREIAKLFACPRNYKSWSAVGGPDLPVKIFARDDQSGTWDTFKTLVLDAHGLELCADADRFESSSELSDRVASDPQAIGFVGLPYVRSARALGIVECDLVYMPTEFSIKTEEYPLARRLFLYTPESSQSPYVDHFVRFALSESGQEEVADLGLVDLSIVPELEGNQQRRLTAALLGMQDGAELQRLVRLTQGATRLSVTFRFEAGSSNLDTRAVRDIERLRNFLSSPENSYQEVFLLGYSDSDGSYRTNLNVSKQRARRIADELGLRGVEIVVDGFGKEAPVACNSSERGKDRNRHVEVWAR